MKLHTLIIISFCFILFGCGSSKNIEKTSQVKPSKKVGLSDQDKMKYDYMFFNANKERMIGNY
ncbi:MAG TPA: hypothetical protein VJI69_08900, partial [Bacteroidia bacterium]|nr:hypothetical protein [Bacteroidia bacterium]